MPGLEIRTRIVAGKPRENLRVITVNGSRILHWRQGGPDGSAHRSVRYQASDRNSSTGLELDSNGKAISRETFYPFGGTALWATRRQTGASYKTIRYSGKERDATGLVYYGYRYYAPWLNAEPAGTVDGLNLNAMCGNNPITWGDINGLVHTLGGQERTVVDLSNIFSWKNKFPINHLSAQPSISLVYGENDTRFYYLFDKAMTNDGNNIYLTINDLNDSLFIVPSFLLKFPNEFFKHINPGVKITDADVSYLIKCAERNGGMQIFRDDVNPNYEYARNRMKQILISWSGFLKQNAGRYSVAANLGKNINEMALFSKNNANRISNLTETAEQTENVCNIFGHHGDAAGFKAANETQNENIKGVFGKAFFRKISRMGLDWAFSGHSLIKGVDFIAHYENRNFNTSIINGKAWKKSVF